MKPAVKFENGQLTLQASHKVDADNDGKTSAEISLEVKLDAAEVISEVAKKDLPWLQALIATIKV